MTAVRALGATHSLMYAQPNAQPRLLQVLLFPAAPRQP